MRWFLPVCAVFLTGSVAAAPEPLLDNLVAAVKEKVKGEFGTNVRDRKTGTTSYEFVPLALRVGMKLLFGTPLDKLQLSKDQLTAKTKKRGEYCNSADSAKDIASFVKEYSINMDEYEPKQVSEYKTFNEFFYRKIHDSSRPLASPADPTVLVSAADCRLNVFKTVQDATSIWIKGRKFSLESLLGDAKLGADFNGGSMAIFRLAPQDYHRFHSPVNGKVSSIKEINGEYYSVNPMAVRSDLDVLTENKRAVAIIDSPQFGKVAYVMVGAAMVGSIKFTGLKADAEVKRGDELGYFAFGGSTVVALFQKDRAVFDQDLAESSAKAVETLVRVREAMGKAAGKTGQK